MVEAIRKRTSRIPVVETDSTGRRFDPIARKLDLGCEFEVINLSRAEERQVGGKFGSHVLTRLTMSMKNPFGLLPQRDKEPFHWRINHGLWGLYCIIKPEVNILDATYVMDGDGPSEGRVRRAGYLAASRDALSLDLAVCELLGLRVEDVEHLNLAARHYPVEYEVKGDVFDLEDFYVPEVGRMEKLAALLQHYSITRKALRQPLIKKGAKRVKALAQRL